MKLSRILFFAILLLTLVALSGCSLLGSAVEGTGNFIQKSGRSLKKL